MGALVLAVAAAGGCGQELAGAPNNGGATGTDPATSELSTLDPCTLLSDAEIEALGFRPDTRRPTETLGLVGCAYRARQPWLAEGAGGHREPYQKLGPPPASLQVTHTVARVSDKAP